jgi:4-alpha-glucanotransferase
LSVATTGTHDINPLAAEFEPEVAAQALRALQQSNSCLALLPLQDAFGWTERINTPSVVNELNWTWRVPRPVDEWSAWPEAVTRQSQLRALTREARR